MDNERILLIEDDKTLAKLFAKKIENALNMKVDVAFSFAESKLFLNRPNYFLTIADLNLPDAPNGEVLDYALEKKAHVLVLSAFLNKEFRSKIVNKNIIDYIKKTGPEDIDLLIAILKRLQKNKNHKVLVVDDSRVFRSQMQNFLQNIFLDVISVAHGEEALGMLKSRSDISLMITDYNMPVMDGLELVKETRKIYPKDQLGIIALSGNEDDEVIAYFLKYGANDYIKKPFSKEEFSCRVNNLLESLENIQTITQYANRDFLTGLYNRRHFYTLMDEYLHDIQERSEPFSLAMVDIDHFKKINDTYGHEAGDKVLVEVTNILNTSLNPNDIIARVGGEEFCIVLKGVDANHAKDIFERLRKKVESCEFKIDKTTKIQCTISIGAVAYDTDESLEENLNEADMLLYKAKESGRNQLTFKKQ